MVDFHCSAQELEAQEVRILDDSAEKHIVLVVEDFGVAGLDLLQVVKVHFLTAVTNRKGRVNQVHNLLASAQVILRDGPCSEPLRSMSQNQEAETVLLLHSLQHFDQGSCSLALLKFIAKISDVVDDSDFRTGAQH